MKNEILKIKKKLKLNTWKMENEQYTNEKSKHDKMEK